MSGVLGKRQSNGPNIQLLEEEQAARSIVVSNISPQTTKQDVMIHFQRRRNGGGEIDHLHIPKKGSAVITFEKGEVIETVLEQSHTLDGSILKLHRLIPDDSFEVLQRVEARINFDRFPLSSLDWKKELEALKDETDVKCRQLFNREYVLCGTFNQISTAQTLVQGILQERPSLLQQSKRGNDVSHQVDTTQTQQNSSEVWDIDNLNTSLVSSFEVQPQFMKFLQQVHRNKLQEIEETHGVKIVWIENASQVQIHSSEILNHPHSYRKGCDSFIDLYQKLYPNMGREVVDIKSADSRDLIIEAINTVEREHQVIIEIKGNKLLVFAEKNNITTSVQVLKETLGSLQGGSRKTNTNLGIREHDNVQEDRFMVLEQLLSHGVKLSLYQSDITDERVDAIVNAANDGLRHGGGVAAAIVRKGGRQIEEGSRQIMFNRNFCPLNVGDAVYTRGGNLSCQFVIHTVGPRWNAHEEKRCTSLLRRACVESLRLAAKLKLSSIAFPAISSGIFGMPKSVCACGMFQAMEEFSSSTDAEISTLRDVRIVIIDDKTINAFREVFLKRFTSPKTSSAISSDQERLRPFNEEQESFSALNVVANHHGFSSAANEPSKKSVKDNDVESRSKRVDPNAENNALLDEEQESPSPLNVVANHPAYSLAHNWSDGQSGKSGRDNNDVESRSKRVDPNAENSGTRNEEQESSSALNVIATRPAFSLADNSSDKPPEKTGEDKNDVESISNGVDPNAGNNEPPNEEQESSSALNVDTNHPASASADNLSDKLSNETGEDNNDVESPSKGVDTKAKNSEPLNEEQKSSSALNVDANHPVFSSADNWSDEPSKKSGKDKNDVESRSKRVDPNAENNEPRNEEQESSALDVVGNHSSFSLADNSSDKPPRKTGEDINDVDSLSKRVDPNAENNKPPNEEHESSSALKVVANHLAFSSADNWSDKPPKKTGEDINDADSLSTGVDPNPENNKPPNEEQESSSALNVINHPACFSADNRSDKPPKTTGEGTKNVESLSKGVDNEPRKQMPDSMKDGHSANTTITSPPTDVKTSNVDTEVNALVKGPELSMTAAFKPLRGRGKGIAATFSGRSHGETGSKSSGGTQIPRKTGDTKSVKTGGGRGMTYAATNSPPGLTVTEEGQHLAREHANRVKGYQNTDPAELMKEKEESERNESNNGAIEDENQDLREKYHQIDEDKLNNLFWSKLPPSDGITNQEETRPSNDGIVDPKKAEETTRNTVEKPLTDDERSLPTDENVSYTTGPMQPDKMPDKSMQVDQSNCSAVNNAASYPEEQPPPSHLEMSPAAETAEETTKNTVEKPLTDDERSLPTDENVNYTTGPMQPDKMPDKSVQVDQLNSSAVNNAASYPEEQPPPSHLEMSPVAETAEETTKNTVEKPLTDDERSLPTDENVNYTTGPMQPDKMPDKSMQVDQSSSSAVNNAASYPEEQPPPSHLEMSPAAEANAPAASFGSVTVQDMGKERQATSADAGSKLLLKMQTTFPAGEPKCSMCMNLNKDPVYPVNCGHYFCKSCTRRFIEKTMSCPVCKKENLFRGNQPVGCMTWRNESYSSLPGYENFGTILLTFNFHSGIQGTEHPNPGEPYRGLFCTSYLPNNPAGQEVCNLLRSAFDTRLIFTVGKCLATGEENKVVFNGIELKTNRSGGPANFGYPDPSYLDRVKSQLAEKGITPPLN